MDRDLVSKVRKRKVRRIAVIAVLAAVCAVIALSLWKRSSGTGKEAGVTLEIRCDSLAEHPELLKDPALKDYIPEDGVILEETPWKIEAGVSSVFDVTDAVCREKGIQIEYSYQPGYDSHYIEGIGYIYEFSAGSFSGWIFSVDGVQPNYGADKVILSGGEKIVWEYTADYMADLSEENGG